MMRIAKICPFPLATIRAPSTPKSKKNWSDRTRRVKLNNLLYGGVFGGIITCYAAFLMFSIYEQTFSPWELRFHAYFMNEVNSWSIVAADLAAVLVCLMLITGLLDNSKHHLLWLWCSFLPGALLAIFWLHHMLRLATFRWDVMWLPLGPLSGTGVCLYVDYLLNQSSEEIRKLRRYMYAYKAY